MDTRLQRSAEARERAHEERLRAQMNAQQQGR
jgi:hypothetical protein